MALSTSNEDYLRAIWKLGEWQDHPVTSGELARTLGLSPSTVSEGVSKLVTRGLVRHAPYGAITLTDEGRVQASRMVRIHRLLETGLVKIFGYTWDEVHEEAEHLEHAVSDLFIERLDAVLGHPTRDPHGDVIPPADSPLAESPDELAVLANLDAGTAVRIERVSDKDSEVLIYLKDLGLVPGTDLVITEVQRGIGLMKIRIESTDAHVALAAARRVLVSVRL
ncbi:metal-dependent transcriptional regulator [Arcanobacterium haemolyticum]|nr:metal-dependent transcriptional regulator [Arcanobacterium haemolyticum]